eukprot:9403724-Lingulodinium_polyedra.AAC.1
MRHVTVNKATTMAAFFTLHNSDERPHSSQSTTRMRLCKGESNLGFMAAGGGLSSWQSFDG